MVWPWEWLWVSAMRSEKSAYSAEEAVAEGEEEVEGELKCGPNRLDDPCSVSASGSPASPPLALPLGFGFRFG
jgi:hypothetical protein